VRASCSSHDSTSNSVPPEKQREPAVEAVTSDIEEISPCRIGPDGADASYSLTTSSAAGRQAILLSAQNLVKQLAGSSFFEYGMPPRANIPGLHRCNECNSAR
jgi:hypothetical protein